MVDTSGSFRDDPTGEIMAGNEVVDFNALFPDDDVPDLDRAIPPTQSMWVDTGIRLPLPSRPSPRRKPHKPPRSILVALPGLVALAVVSAFFAWVSAEPFWLSLGHDVDGTVTVLDCDASGFAPRCEGEFLPVDSVEKMAGVRITGDAEAKQVGETVAAQAVSHKSRSVYVGDDIGLRLRWGIGLGVLLVCGIGIAAITGAWRWRGRARILTVLACLAGPVLLWLGALALTW